MNLYHISQQANNDYDTYSDAVVAAPDEETARQMHPDGGDLRDEGSFGTWVSTPNQVTVKLVGIAVDGTPQGVVCASFHAG